MCLWTIISATNFEEFLRFSTQSWNNGSVRVFCVTIITWSVAYCLLYQLVETRPTVWHPISTRIPEWNDDECRLHFLKLESHRLLYSPQEIKQWVPNILLVRSHQEHPILVSKSLKQDFTSISLGGCGPSVNTYPGLCSRLSVEGKTVHTSW